MLWGRTRTYSRTQRTYVCHVVDTMDMAALLHPMSMNKNQRRRRLLWGTSPRKKSKSECTQLCNGILNIYLYEGVFSIISFFFVFFCWWMSAYWIDVQTRLMVYKLWQPLNRLIYLWQTLDMFLLCWCKCVCVCVLWCVPVCGFLFFSYPCVGACATYVQQIVKTSRF